MYLYLVRIILRTRYQATSFLTWNFFSKFCFTLTRSVTETQGMENRSLRSFYLVSLHWIWWNKSRISLVSLLLLGKAILLLVLSSSSKVYQWLFLHFSAKRTWIFLSLVNSFLTCCFIKSSCEKSLVVAGKMNCSLIKFL